MINMGMMAMNRIDRKYFLTKTDIELAILSHKIRGVRRCMK